MANGRLIRARSKFPSNFASAVLIKKPLQAISALLIRFWQPITSAPSCLPKLKPQPIRTGLPIFIHAFPILTPILPKRAPPQFYPGLALIPKHRRVLAMNFRVAGACGWRWRRCCFHNLICCFLTSQPTISILKARSGLRHFWQNTDIRFW